MFWGCDGVNLGACRRIQESCLLLYWCMASPVLIFLENWDLLLGTSQQTLQKLFTSLLHPLPGCICDVLIHHYTSPSLDFLTDAILSFPPLLLHKASLLADGIFLREEERSEREYIEQGWGNKHSFHSSSKPGCSNPRIRLALNGKGGEQWTWEGIINPTHSKMIIK